MKKGGDIMKEDYSIGVLTHVLNIFFPLLGPLVIWLIYKDRSDFVDQHGREAINFAISFYIYSFVSWMLCLVIIGFFILPFLLVAFFVFPIIGATKANEGKLYRSPISIKIL